MKTYIHPNGMKARPVRGGYELDQLISSCRTKQAVVFVTEQHLIEFGFKPQEEDQLVGDSIKVIQEQFYKTVLLRAIDTLKVLSDKPKEDNTLPDHSKYELVNEDRIDRVIVDYAQQTDGAKDFAKLRQAIEKHLPNK